MSLIKNLLQILEEGQKAFNQEFLQYLHSNQKIKRAFSDMSELEDLFDYAYLDDVKGETIAEIVVRGKKKVPDLAKVEREAFSKAKWVIDNMSSDHKKEWKTLFLQLAKEWAKKVAPAIATTAESYIN